MNRFWKSGDPFVWLTGGMLAISLLMVGGLLALILTNALGYFWPATIERFDLDDGTTIVGQVTAREEVPDAPGQYRIQIKRANRDVFGSDFLWLDESRIAGRRVAAGVFVVERLEWGDFYGFLERVERDGDVVAQGAAAPAALAEAISEAHAIRERIGDLDKGEIGGINYEQERIRLELRGLEREGVESGPRVEELRDQERALDARYESAVARLRELRKQLDVEAVFTVPGRGEQEVEAAGIVRATRPNDMSVAGKIGFYAVKVLEFVWENPREANTEGGVFPAIFGTVFMVILMSIFVTPLGVLAAFYLREYAKQGTFVSIVRIAVYNLAGVPAIVFGVFGVGFFIYFVGGTLDQLLYADTLPTPTYGTGGILWASLTLSLLTVPSVIVTVEEGLAAIPRGTREASLALGATQFETMWRVVLPAVTPAILTGLILAVARAAGEVAPLMLTGVVKLAPELPIDGYFPYLHLDRKFMHLGFHIYDVGFQSPNVDAARPMVYMTTLLLLLTVIGLNLAAIVLRNRLRKRYAVSGL